MTINEQKEFYQKLGEQIKNARMQAGLKQETFASFLDLSRASIVNIEKGRQHPPIHMLWVIAKVLNIEVVGLFPEYKSFKKISTSWEEIISQHINNDKDINKEKLVGFIEELQSSKKI